MYVQAFQFINTLPLLEKINYSFLIIQATMNLKKKAYILPSFTDNFAK